MRRLHRILALAVLGVAATTPARAQNPDWQYQWFWGVKGGVLTYSLPTPGQVVSPQVGAEWLITARRTALYLGLSQTVGVAESDAFSFSNISGSPVVGFDGMRRIQIAVLVFPTNGTLQPYAGGGFVIETLPNATASGLTGTALNAAQNAVDNASSGGFFITMVGAQLRMRKLAIFAQAQFSPQGRDFLLSGSATSIELGLRYALTGAREDDVTTRR
jgi:hypothetical protein